MARLSLLVGGMPWTDLLLSSWPSHGLTRFGTRSFRRFDLRGKQVLEGVGDFFWRATFNVVCFL